MKPIMNCFWNLLILHIFKNVSSSASHKKIGDSFQHIHLSTDFDKNIFYSNSNLTKTFLNAEIMKTQIFILVKYDFKGNAKSHKAFLSLKICVF